MSRHVHRSSATTQYQVTIRTRQSRFLAPLGTPALFLLTCYGPNPTYINPASGLPPDDDAHESDASDVESGATSATSTAASSETQGTGTSSNTGDPSNDECGDGAPGPRLCFAAAIQYSTDAAHSLALARVDPDPYVDLVIGLKDGIAIARGEPNAEFAIHTFEAPQGEYWGVSVADLDLDGSNEVLATNSSTNQLLVFDYSNELTLRDSFDLHDKPRKLVVADVSADDIADVITSCEGSDTVTVHLGIGDGTFGPMTSYAVADKPFGILAAFADNNATVDIVASSLNERSFGTLTGLGNGSFSPWRSFTVNSRASAITTGDFDGDDCSDIALGSTDGTVSIALGDCSGSFDSPGAQYPALEEVSDIVARDINGDGNEDILVADAKHGTIGVLQGRPGGTFATCSILDTLGETPSVTILGIADLDGDDVEDIVAAGDAGLFVALANP